MLHRNLCFLEKFVETRDPIFLARAMRFSSFVRRHCGAAHLRKLAETYVADPARRAQLLELQAAAEEGRSKAAAAAATKVRRRREGAPAPPPVPPTLLTFSLSPPTHRAGCERGHRRGGGRRGRRR